MTRNSPFDFSDDEDIDYTSDTSGSAGSTRAMGTSSGTPGSGDEIVTSGSSSLIGTSMSEGLTDSNPTLGSLSGMGDESDMGSHEPGSRRPHKSAKVAEQSATQQTKMKASPRPTGKHDSPTSMSRKRGNQPR